MLIEVPSGGIVTETYNMGMHDSNKSDVEKLASKYFIAKSMILSLFNMNINDAHILIIIHRYTTTNLKLPEYAFQFYFKDLKNKSGIAKSGMITIGENDSVIRFNQSDYDDKNLINISIATPRDVSSVPRDLHSIGNHNEYPCNTIASSEDNRLNRAIISNEPAPEVIYAQSSAKDYLDSLYNKKSTFSE